MKLRVGFLIFGLLAMAPSFADEGEFVYNDHKQRDPFLPLVTPTGSMISYESDVVVAEMVLEGVVSDKKGGLAIINGAIVEQGGHIGQYVVRSIKADRVVLEKDGQQSELRLKKEE